MKRFAKLLEVHREMSRFNGPSRWWRSAESISERARCKLCSLPPHDGVSKGAGSGIETGPGETAAASGHVFVAACSALAFRKQPDVDFSRGLRRILSARDGSAALQGISCPDCVPERC